MTSTKILSFPHLERENADQYLRSIVVNKYLEYEKYADWVKGNRYPTTDGVFVAAPDLFLLSHQTALDTSMKE
ncbi:hypothetical protein E2C01_028912 [Portunus trituberculatus]|uniref:Uncharacterized protein n=1 Tax=Portunus trituberculatus TaxID=210409 RepID=A0A5B7EQC6_PORTR|nr:hypothetical protein [Portunus trituberculatus]